MGVDSQSFSDIETILLLHNCLHQLIGSSPHIDNITYPTIYSIFLKKKACLVRYSSSVPHTLAQGEISVGWPMHSVPRYVTPKKNWGKIG